jgi:branched-chain amino acid aminotransferase
MLSSRGYVAEATGENIFLAAGGKLITPAEGEDLLAGITRGTLMTLAARELDLEVVERSVNRSELYTADEIFLCGTALEITPVLAVDRHAVGIGSPGPLTRELQRLYAAVTRAEHPDYLDWCVSAPDAVGLPPNRGSETAPAAGDEA